jgi:putative membrane protein
VSLKASTNLIETGALGRGHGDRAAAGLPVVDMVLRGLPKRIQEGEMAAAAMLVGAKLATALILAAAVAG